MKNIEEVYLRKITQQILLEMLKDGVIPTSTALIGKTREQTDNLDLANPRLAQPRPAIAYGEEASASKFNNILSRLADDLDVLYDVSLISEKDIGLSSMRTLTELNQIGKTVNGLIERAARLLLTTDQTEGLLAVLGDSFEDSTLIDLDATTAYVDTFGQCVHGAFLDNAGVDLVNSLDLTALQASDIRVTPLDTSLTPSPGTHNSSVLDMFNQNDNAWHYRARGPSTLDVAPLEIKIDFRSAIRPPEAFLTISKVIIDPATTNNSMLILLQYSKDGITWNDFPVNDPVRRINAATTYLAEEVELTHLRIVLTKDIHDSLSGGYIYDFGIKNIALFGYHQVFTDTSDLVSTRLLLTDPTGAEKTFTMAALSTACEHVPADTTIDYGIAFLLAKEAPGEEEDPYTQTEFFKVIPLNRENPIGPTIIEVAGSSQVITEATINTAEEEFPFKENSINRLLLTGTEISGSNVQVWRNVGSNLEWKTVKGVDGKAVDAGWYFDSPYYVTYALVDDIGGKEFDFGPNPIEIDGVEAIGRVRLSRGVHKCRVHERSWFSVKGLHHISAVEPLTKKLTGNKSVYGENGLSEELTETLGSQVIDPLYPYNHKLLIEGLVYDAGYRGEKPYSGVKRFAAFFPKQTTEAEMGLIVENHDYSKFTVTRTDGSTAPRIMVKWVQIDEENPRESFLIITTSGDRASGLVFKATFNSTNPKRTSSLDGYEIKVS